MKLHILSDLHLEFAQFFPSDESMEADVICLPGDIWKNDHGIAMTRSMWPEKPIVYLAGNHEYYGKVRMNVESQLRMAAKQYDVHYLQNEDLILDGVRFLGCTLWTDFKLFGEDKKLDCMSEGMKYISDFRVIHEGDRIFSPTDAIALFNESHAFLKSHLETPFNGKTVVMTHHLPSMRSVSGKYKEVLASACFASNLDDLLDGPELWIHGHTHDSFDYMAGRTRVICNPRGYVTNSKPIENGFFNPKLIVEI